MRLSAAIIFVVLGIAGRAVTSPVEQEQEIPGRCDGLSGKCADAQNPDKLYPCSEGTTCGNDGQVCQIFKRGEAEPRVICSKSMKDMRLDEERTGGQAARVKDAPNKIPPEPPIGERLIGVSTAQGPGGKGPAGQGAEGKVTTGEGSSGTAGKVDDAQKPAGNAPDPEGSATKDPKGKKPAAADPAPGSPGAKGVDAQAENAPIPVDTLQSDDKKKEKGGFRAGVGKMITKCKGLVCRT